MIRELSLRSREPIVNLSLLGNRGFAASNVVMFFVGFILFGTTQLLPQMVQTVFGYTATRAGLVITPGGVAVLMLMPVAGFLINKVQPRYMIMFGLFVEGCSLYYLSGLNTNAAYFDIALGRIFQASGLAFLIIPITTVAYVGLPPGTSNDASALINLSRNIGGSFGISLAQTMLARRGQFHQSRLVEHASDFDPQYVAAHSSIMQSLINTGATRRRRDAAGDGRHLRHGPAAGDNPLLHGRLLRADVGLVPARADGTAA